MFSALFVSDGEKIFRAECRLWTPIGVRRVRRIHPRFGAQCRIAWGNSIHIRGDHHVKGSSRSRSLPHPRRVRRSKIFRGRGLGRQLCVRDRAARARAKRHRRLARRDRVHRHRHRSQERGRISLLRLCRCGHVRRGELDRWPISTVCRQDPGAAGGVTGSRCRHGSTRCPRQVFLVPSAANCAHGILEYVSGRNSGRPVEGRRHRGG